MSITNLLYWYWLRDIKNIGPARAKALLDHFESPELVFQADLESYLEVPGIGKDMAKAIAESKIDLKKAQETLEREALLAQKIGASVLVLHDPTYPSLLKEQIAVGPPLLYVRGSLIRLSRQTIAIVGTREPSIEGRRWAREFSNNLVQRGWQIISGLAAGIDAEGHQGALDAGGYTIAVLGCGVDRIYPPENRRLFEEILANGGAIVSEYPFGTPPKGDNLRKRNKITVALSCAVVVAECPVGSGTLIAADEAFEQGKPVFAFDFPDERKSSAGSRALLHRGDAKAVEPSTTPEDLARAIEAFHETKIAALFDLDGVLGDTKRLSCNALIHAIKKIDGRSLTKKDAEKVVSLSPRAALRQLSQGDIESLLSAFNTYWNQNFSRDLVAQPQLASIMEKIKNTGMPLGLVTSRNQAHATAALTALKIRELFDELTTWGDTTQHKPDPAPIRHALERLPRSSGAVYVGDQSDDVAAAKAAGITAVVALWFLEEEAKTKISDARPDYFVRQPSELFDLLLQLKRMSWSLAKKDPGA